MSFLPPSSWAFEFSLGKSVVVLFGALLLACTDLMLRLRGRRMHLLFACILGTVLAVALIKVTGLFLEAGFMENPHAAALGLLITFLCWRALFGPWEPSTKATVLGTALFWIIFRAVAGLPPGDRMIHLFAGAVALVPAVVWCGLFLHYHRERLSLVFQMFFTGMLSTAPILFYDAVVRRGIEFQFFLFRITPESFHATSRAFVAGELVQSGGLRTALATALLSFLLVGFVEEGTKCWMLRKSMGNVFRNVDDVMQFAILLAIGFAFAENISNPAYFRAFVEDYLLRPERADVVGFLGNVTGRSILTSMVHVVSTGVMGYFLGLALFAGPCLVERHRAGRCRGMLHAVAKLIRVREESVFRFEMVTLGLVFAVLLHGFFNFLVTLPDLLPTHPKTLADVVPGVAPFIFRVMPLLLLPSLLYVVGGFWLLTALFMRMERLRERGALVPG